MRKVLESQKTNLNVKNRTVPENQWDGADRGKPQVQKVTHCVDKDISCSGEGVKMVEKIDSRGKPTESK